MIEKESRRNVDERQRRKALLSKRSETRFIISGNRLKVFQFLNLCNWCASGRKGVETHSIYSCLSAFSIQLSRTSMAIFTQQGLLLLIFW